MKETNKQSAERDMRNEVTHCFNCTERDNTELPEKYQDLMGELMSVRGIKLCPRCKCPEVLTETKNYQPSYGYEKLDMAMERKK